MKTTSLFILFILWEFSIPKLNTLVIEYVDSVMGKKVNSGECWDLASEALIHAGAFLDRSSQKSIYIFGNKLNPKKDNIIPGDIIQLENVTLEYSKADRIYTETMSHHTAIIYKVLKKDHYMIAHQNTSFYGRKVGISELNMENIKKGDIIFYRPYKK